MRRTAVGVGSLALAAVLLPQTGADAAAGDPTPSPSPTPTATVSAAPLPSDTTVRSFSYGAHPRQRMDVWWHTTGERRPAVFIIHGGWWSGGDKKATTSISRSYAQLGYTVITINYRLSGDAPWPAQRSDALNAIATVRKHAETFNMDPDRYVVLGFSAGGHIAAAVGTYGDGLPGLRGVAGVSPVISPLTSFSDGDAGGDAYQRKLRKATVALAGGCGPTQCAKVWSSMEVAFHASAGDAPMLTVHSDDEFVPPYQSELLKQTLDEVGVKMTIRTMPGVAHSSALYREPGVAEGVQSWIASRLAK
ncbi:alpha/beta hydrolase [Microtetraspora niveoalba]|uniref:alpha/beta hydrolase n=1 Tax=Microtetraspora niveoalba TaxID=46175 RepID=UPI0008351560|nr:alpha/beta hydrolase [Microtetraspora niveoalba]